MQTDLLQPDDLRPLRRVFVAKIAITSVLWAPLIVVPPCFFQSLKIPIPQPMLFVRLLGAAYVALLVGYFGGLREARANRYPAGPVRVGIVSNGLAAIILAIHGPTGAWSSWGAFAQGLMWVSLGATIAITAGLVRYRR